MWSWLSVALAGYISITAHQSNQLKQAVVFKTLSLLMLLAILWSGSDASLPVLGWMTLALLVSAVADGLYLFNKHHNLSFSLFVAAQACLSGAFWSLLSGQFVWWVPIMMLAIAIVIFLLLLPQIDRFILPIVVMGGMLIQLNWVAVEVWLLMRSTASLLALAGAMMLTLSAALVLVYDFRKQYAYGRFWTSGSYLLAYSLMIGALII
ncbi:lysoplasmalogenase family protein [Vibrio sp.]|uniref:lysoplasmalogenase family protein n=1 Tax=Vibrio sp. TaxID=678 RepID=UPI003D0A7BA1